MLSAPEYLGETKFVHKEETFVRTWHVWAYYEDTGELTAIQYGISTNLDCASKVIKRSECITPLQQHLWGMAEERLQDGLIFDDVEDFEVIEPFESKVLPFTRS
jgi:hypothetical protein